MKRAVILVPIVLGFVFLLGASGPNPGVHDPNEDFSCYQAWVSRERILEYEILFASDPKTLSDEVTKRLKDKKENWTVVGGISVGNGKCHQAMVKMTK